MKKRYLKIGDVCGHEYTLELFLNFESNLEWKKWNFFCLSDSWKFWNSIPSWILKFSEILMAKRVFRSSTPEKSENFLDKRLQVIASHHLLAGRVVQSYPVPVVEGGCWRTQKKHKNKIDRTDCFLFISASCWHGPCSGYSNICYVAVNWCGIWITANSIRFPLSWLSLQIFNFFLIICALFPSVKLFPDNLQYCFLCLYSFSHLTILTDWPSIFTFVIVW